MRYRLSSIVTAHPYPLAMLDELPILHELARGSKISTVEILLFPSYPPTANLKHKLSCFSVHNNEADYASLGLQGGHRMEMERKSLGTHKDSLMTATEWDPLLALILGSRVQKPSLGSYLSADLCITIILSIAKSKDI